MHYYTNQRYLPYRVFRGVVAFGQTPGGMGNAAIGSIQLNTGLRYALFPSPQWPWPNHVIITFSGCVVFYGPCARPCLHFSYAGEKRGFLDHTIAWIFECGHYCHFKCAQGLIDLAWKKAPEGGLLTRDSQILCPGNRAKLDAEGNPGYSQYGEMQMDLCRGPMGTTGSVEFKSQHSNESVQFPLSHSPTTRKEALHLTKDGSGKSKRKLEMNTSGSGSGFLTPHSVSMSSSGDFLTTKVEVKSSTTIIKPCSAAGSAAAGSGKCGEAVGLDAGGVSGLRAEEVRWSITMWAQRRRMRRQ